MKLCHFVLYRFVNPTESSGREYIADVSVARSPRVGLIAHRTRVVLITVTLVAGQRVNIHHFTCQQRHRDHSDVRTPRRHRSSTTQLNASFKAPGRTIASVV